MQIDVVRCKLAMFDDAMKTINRSGLNANRSESTYTNMMVMTFAEIGRVEKKRGGSVRGEKKIYL